MAEPDWKKIGEIIDVCSEHQEKHKVDPLLWGACEQCPVEDSCPNFSEQKEKSNVRKD